jgi:hypothetical protein
MDDTQAAARLSVLKDVLYVDKVYAGVAELRRRSIEPLRGEADLRLAELRIFSQNGEDGVTCELLRHLPDVPTHFVEFGVGDGWSCNTRVLAEVFGWSGTYFEIDPDTHAQLQERYTNCARITAVQAAVTPDTINDLFSAAGVPDDFGVLCIDIDGQDYWVWEALSSGYRPAVIIAEVNLAYGLEDAVCEVPGAPQDVLTETWGASLRAMEHLARSKGYRLVHVEMAGVNAFFVRDDLLADTHLIGVVERSPNYGLRGRNHSLERLYEQAERVPRETTRPTS